MTGQRALRLLGLLLLFAGLAWLVRRTVRGPAASLDALLHSTTSSSYNGKYPHNPRYAYVCLCANLRAVYPTLVLFQQLRRVRATRGLHVALVSTEVPEGHQEVLRRFGITVVTYAPRPLFRPAYETHSRSTWERDRILWQKLRAWSLTAYDRVIMLDYDLLILRNFDELFDQGELAGVPMLHAEEKVVFWQEPLVGDPPALLWHNLTKVSEARVGWTGLNSGVLVLQPDARTFKELLTAASELSERTCCPSQEFIFRFFQARGQYTRLPAIYNLRKIHLLPAEEQRHYRETVKIYHFVEKRKPIVMGRKQAQGEAFSAQWWQHADAVDRALGAMRLEPAILRSLHVEAIRSALQ